MTLEIIIDKDWVTIEGQVVKRPIWMAPSAWVEFWQRAVDPSLVQGESYGFDR
jgi:hypothetical protein